MKKIIFAFCFTLFLVQTNAQFSNANLVAGGLTCSMCSKAIYKALSKVSFVDNVITDIKTTSYNIRFKDTIINPDQLRKAVEDAGFTVLSLVITTELKNVKIEKDTHIRLQDKTFHFLQTEQTIINDTVQLQIVDKSYVSDKMYKTYKTTTTMNCFETGKMASCCNDDQGHTDERVYHVILLK